MRPRTKEEELTAVDGAVAAKPWSLAAPVAGVKAVR